jgi:AraC-like DNA-binding protein
MRYTEHQPSPSLADQLECFWFVSDDAPPHKAEERVLPDGCVEWIFHLGAPFHHWTEIEGWRLQPRSFVVGELTQFLLLQPTGLVATMGVRFRPGGAYRFLPLPLDLLTDNAVPTGDIWGRAGTYLEDEVLNARTDLERTRVVERFLIGRLLNAAPRQRFDAAVGEIMRSRGQTRVDQLAYEIGGSRRQLEREFRASSGLTPKALARIIRFQNLLRLVGDESLRSWVGLALESGFADQPHMVREFREFTGQSPTGQQTTGAMAQNFVSPQRLASLLGPSR